MEKARSLEYESGKRELKGMRNSFFDSNSGKGRQDLGNGGTRRGFIFAPSPHT